MCYGIKKGLDPIYMGSKGCIMYIRGRVFQFISRTVHA